MKVSDLEGHCFVACVVEWLVTDLTPAVRAARGHDTLVWPRVVNEVRQRHLSFGVGLAIALHRLDRLNVELNASGCQNLVEQKDRLAACPVPALILP
jgi:hypothetical protein